MVSRTRRVPSSVGQEAWNETPPLAVPFHSPLFSSLPPKIFLDTRLGMHFCIYYQGMGGFITGPGRL